MSRGSQTLAKFRFNIAERSPKVRFVFQHEQASEEASTILGDKLQQKMDSVTFAQERMKRQLKDLQEKVQGTPADVTDIKDRIEGWTYVTVFAEKYLYVHIEMWQLKLKRRLS